MNRLTMIPAVIGLGVAGVAVPASAQGEHDERRERSRQEARGRVNETEATNSDIDKLYALVRQTRAELAVLRVQAGLRGQGRREGRGKHTEGGREERGEHREGREGGRESRGEHAEGEREGRGEHTEREREGRGGGEEGGTRLGKNERWDETRNGARLVLAYNPATQSFQGAVYNTTEKALSDVRVEVHLSNGVELGPTKRTDLKPRGRIRVELSAADQRFTWWTTHPEHGSEEGHGPGHEDEADEHGEGTGNRPTDPALRPLYNQLQLLRQEIRVLARVIESRR